MATSVIETAPFARATVGLTLRGVTKRFGSLVANDRIDLDIVPGRIHCLLGENGAGKSTLMNVLYGLLKADEGTICINDVEQHFRDSRDAIDAGIGMVHQHFMLVDVFSVAENIVLGREPGKLGVLNTSSARQQVRDLSARYHLDVDPDAIVENLPVGVQQRVEILKALCNDAKYLIFDEPTAVLTPQETDELMGIMRALRDEGHAIVFITHKLHEVRAVADDITVIRRGRVVGQATHDMSEAKLAEMMVGRSVNLLVNKTPANPGEVRLQVEKLKVSDPTGAIVVNGVSFEVRAGEILCVAGVQGNGQTELAAALLGLTPILSGTVKVGDKDLTKANTHVTLAAGVGYVPEDRQKEGLVSELAISENLILNQLDRYGTFGRLDVAAIEENARIRVAEFDVRTPSVELPASSLSGGNQQKLVMARELSRPLQVLVASQPTRGVDVGAVEFLHSRIIAERDKGSAVLIISTELDEVENLADRVAVIYRGKLVGIVPPDTPRDVIGLMMAGTPYTDACADSDVSLDERVMV
ncbi:MAG: ABC transporter ATP-binding protein [Propionibacteriaceae bacterium]|nr:ABC transporter ATP-binding protein [Propionibacteriaceae bacterium]